MSKNVVIFDIVMAAQELSKTRASRFYELTRKKNRDRSKLFIVEGEKNVTDSLDGFELENLICCHDWLSCHPEFEKRFDTKILVGSKTLISKITSFSTPPDVMAVFRMPDRGDISENYKAKGVSLLLDDIQDPGNLGTIIRTCDWFGVYDIFASTSSVDCYNPKVVQSAMGSLTRVRVWYTDLCNLIESNREIPVYGALLDGRDYRSVEKPKTSFLIMGNEGNGISETLTKKITVPLTIPPANPKSHPDSLNVAIATSILLAQLT